MAEDGAGVGNIHATPASTEQPSMNFDTSQQKTPQTPQTPQPSAQPQAQTESTEPESKPNNAVSSQVSSIQWKMMWDVVMAIYDYRELDGHDPSRLFHRSVNKRNVPDYYSVIKEPMALSVLKQKIRNRTYTHFTDFVRDCALIPHNAQTYNRPKSQAYEDALVIKDVFSSEFRKLAEQGIITPETAELPDLGEIPEADPLPAEEEEEEEGEETDEEGTRRRRRRGPRGNSKRESGAKDDFHKTDPDLRKKRGRPPRVDTPMEARIKAVLKGIRKLKDGTSQLKVRHFERLPDKSAYPDYYTEISDPMAIDIIKRKSKRKKYNSVDHFMADVDTMFNNAKAYNQAESQLYNDAVDLQREAHRLAQQEKNKPDSEYLMEDGRLPLPNGIAFNGDIWRVGDWAHVQNPNEGSKPIVAQIYRTWQDSEGQKWINACWYYRPEQTIHHFEKHFFPNEVVKTGQYRDHRIEEVVDRCFVMFFTRYNRGRPRGLPPDKEVYVCEARYNEEKHKLNKIKTWASCLPDEVREKDYEMDLFDAPRKIKKVPSPIKHLLSPDAKETDDLPKPTWGVENAPPIVGAVHRRPRDENESPPPEPSPSPPLQHMSLPATAPAMLNRPVPLAQSQTGRGGSIQADPRISSSSTPSLPGGGVMPHTPIPPPAAQPPIMSNRIQPFRQPPATAPTYPTNNANRPAQIAPQISQPPLYPTAPQPQPYSTPHNFPSYQGARIPQPPITPHPYNPNAPRPIETFHLQNNMDAAIPKLIRHQFQCDDQGRVLFFSTPPLDIVPFGHQGLGHSISYLAAKEERQKLIAERAKKERKERENEAKRQKTEAAADAECVNRITEGALKVLTNQLQKDTEAFYKLHYNDAASYVMEEDKKKREAILATDKVVASKAGNSLATSDTFVSLKRNWMSTDDIA